MHVLGGIILTIVTIGLIYFCMRKMEQWGKASRKAKIRAKIMEDELKAYKEVKKINTKDNKEKIKKVEDFLRD